MERNIPAPNADKLPVGMYIGESPSGGRKVYLTANYEARLRLTNLGRVLPERHPMRTSVASRLAMMGAS